MSADTWLEKVLCEKKEERGCNNSGKVALPRACAYVVDGGPPNTCGDNCFDHCANLNTKHAFDDPDGDPFFGL